LGHTDVDKSKKSSDKIYLVNKDAEQRHVTLGRTDVDKSKKSSDRLPLKH